MLRACRTRGSAGSALVDRAQRFQVMADAAEIADFEQRFRGQLALHVQHVLHGVRRAAVVGVGEGIGSRARWPRPPAMEASELSQFRFGIVGIGVEAQPAGQVARHVEARVAGVLRIEHAGAGADDPLRRRGPGDAEARREVVLVDAHQPVAERCHRSALSISDPAQVDALVAVLSRLRPGA